MMASIWDIDGLKFGLSEINNSSKDTIFALHGFTGSSSDWSTLANQLATRRLIAPDILGHGLSEYPIEPELYEMSISADQLLFVMEHRQIDNFHLVGYSMGGRLALYIATHYPDRVKSLTLVSASPGLKTEAEREVRRQSDNGLADKIEKNGIAWFVDFWENLPLWDSQSAELKAELREKRLQNNPVGLANSLRGMGTGVMPSLWEKLPDLPMPVNLIVGELDAKFVAINQEMAELIPDVALTIIPDTGHAAHLEKPGIFKDILLNFLNKHKSI